MRTPSPKLPAPGTLAFSAFHAAQTPQRTTLLIFFSRAKQLRSNERSPRRESDLPYLGSLIFYGQNRKNLICLLSQESEVSLSLGGFSMSLKKQVFESAKLPALQTWPNLRMNSVQAYYLGSEIKCTAHPHVRESHTCAVNQDLSGTYQTRTSMPGKSNSCPWGVCSLVVAQGSLAKRWKPSRVYKSVLRWGIVHQISADLAFFSDTISAQQDRKNMRLLWTKITLSYLKFSKTKKCSSTHSIADFICKEKCGPNTFTDLLANVLPK